MLEVLSRRRDFTPTIMKQARCSDGHFRMKQTLQTSTVVNASVAANQTALGEWQHSVSSQPGNQLQLPVNINEYQKLDSKSKSINS
jgi:hypothetical protein